MANLPLETSQREEEEAVQFICSLKNYQFIICTTDRPPGIHINRDDYVLNPHHLLQQRLLNCCCCPLYLLPAENLSKPWPIAAIRKWKGSSAKARKVIKNQFVVRVEIDVAYTYRSIHNSRSFDHQRSFTNCFSLPVQISEELNQSSSSSSPLIIFAFFAAKIQPVLISLTGKCPMSISVTHSLLALPLIEIVKVTW